jgi:hypothetical protein
MLFAANASGDVACGDGGGSQQTTTLSASLSGDQEVPPPFTGAVGIGTLSLDLPSRNIRGGIVLDGMTATAAHIHLGDAGVNGPIIVPLAETSSGTWSVPAGATLTESQADAFAAGGLYFNAHSTANPNGEIRGQIGRDVFNVQMSPAQEVPPPASSATSTGLPVDPRSGDPQVHRPHHRNRHGCHRGAHPRGRARCQRADHLSLERNRGRQRDLGVRPRRDP